MKVVKKDGDHRVFQISKREKRLLFVILKLYPLIPTAHHRLSKTADPKEVEADQRLLEEALAEQKKESKAHLMALLNEEQRFVEADRGYRLTLSIHQIDWLLQVLNDIRVGCWLKLGCPDKKTGKPVEVNRKNVRYFFVMELCVLYQAALLQSFDQPM